MLRIYEGGGGANERPHKDGTIFKLYEHRIDSN